MADVEGHRILCSHNFSVDEETLGSGLPFLEIPGSSSDFSNDTDLVSYGAGLGGQYLLLCGHQQTY